MIEFPFKKIFSPKFGEVLKPIIPVTIIGLKKKVNVFMLLDSGADISLIPYSVGKFIGLELNISRRGEIQGIGEGSIPYILSNVKFQIQNNEILVRIGWALIEEVPFIIGRLDVFEKFAVEFREFENKIILKKGRKKYKN
jgi:hypothetical protein